MTLSLIRSVLGALFLVSVAPPSVLAADAASNFEQSPSHAGHFQTPFDSIPDFGASPSIESVKSGSWTDPSVWSKGRLPNASDVVLLKHRIVYDSVDSTVHTLAIDAGGAWICALSQSTKLAVGTLLNKPGGRLECGTAAAPLAAAYKAEIVIRDLALQTSPNTAGVYDPSQYRYRHRRDRCDGSPARLAGHELPPSRGRTPGGLSHFDARASAERLARR